jgi:DNA mismatch repair protein MutH
MPDQLTLPTPGPTASPLDRRTARARLDELVGRDLRALAPLCGVTFERDGQRNKGWAGQVVERFLGLGPDVRQRPDFGDWELKVVPLLERADGRLVPRETMAVTMFDEGDLESLEFEASHLREKLQRQVIVSRLYLGPSEPRSVVLGHAAFDLTDAELLADIRGDYEEIRWVARTQGLAALTGHIGRWIQPRPKGEGHGRGGHGFYARKALVARMLRLDGDLSEAGSDADSLR